MPRDQAIKKMSQSGQMSLAGCHRRVLFAGEQTGILARPSSIKERSTGKFA